MAPVTVVLFLAQLDEETPSTSDNPKSTTVVMEYIDIAVIGGGPAGLMAAIAAAGQLAAAQPSSATGHPLQASQSLPPGPSIKTAGRPRIVVFEKGPRPGRKLLASGSGRCNLTHEGDIGSFLGHYGGGEKPPGNPADDGNRAPGSAGRFLRKALYDFDNKALRLWLAARGLATEADDNGKVFPVSGKATDVLAVMLREAGAAGVEIRVSTKVESVSLVKVPRTSSLTANESLAILPGSEDCLELNSETSSWLVRAAVLAAGGHSYPALGSTGDSWLLAAGLGHTIVDPGPALAPIYVKSFFYTTCAGISLPGSSVVIRRNGRVVARSEERRVGKEC